jgi:hypothetical protein
MSYDPLTLSQLEPPRRHREPPPRDEVRREARSRGLVSEQSGNSQRPAQDKRASPDELKANRDDSKCKLSAQAKSEVVGRMSNKHLGALLADDNLPTAEVILGCLYLARELLPRLSMSSH